MHMHVPFSSYYNTRTYKQAYLFLDKFIDAISNLSHRNSCFLVFYFKLPLKPASSL
jgi:hypothetical protein